MSAGAQVLEAPFDELDVQSREPRTLKSAADTHLVIYGDCNCPFVLLGLQHGGRWLRDYQQARGRPRFR